TFPDRVFAARKVRHRHRTGAKLPARGLPTLVHPALRPDEQVGSGSDRESFQQTGRLGPRKRHQKPTPVVCVSTGGTGQSRPQDLSLTVVAYAAHQKFWRENRRRPGRGRIALAPAGGRTARAAEE